MSHFVNYKSNTMKKIVFISVFMLLKTFFAFATDIWIEAESFKNKGGWQIDQQFMDVMGSPYLIAHGMGVPVADASTDIDISKGGTYSVYVRTYNWTSVWSEKKGAGSFLLAINGKRLPVTLGDTGNKWQWQKAGEITLKKGKTQLKLKDLTGFDGRCDAIFLTMTNQMPPDSGTALSDFRKKMLHYPDEVPSAGRFDLVVVGGGIAGISTAVSASRLGLKVALIQNRPVLGGNNSSEVRVHLGGKIEIGKYPQLGGLLKEFAPTRKGNAKPASNYADDKKLEIIQKEPNISLFLNTHVSEVKCEGQKIQSIVGVHIETGKPLHFEGELFADCTGDATVGYLAGADFAIGREAKETFQEELAPEVADNMIMGASVQWYSVEDKKASSFPDFQYGITFTEETAEKVHKGDWMWETGMNKDQINNFEEVRDYGLLVAYSNWAFLKNYSVDKKEYRNRRLEWVAYIAGKRETRRLLGDYILSEQDLVKNVAHEDASFTTTWSIDIHYPDSLNSIHFPEKEFKSVAKHKVIYPYDVPYRCLYSRNVDNLFMAGRNISVTHVALGTVRVMRTTGMMGEVVGMAAFVCRKHNVLPRAVYTKYFDEMKALMRQGIGGQGLPNNQQYNEGGFLSKPPVVQ